MVLSHSFAPTPVQPSPTPNKPLSARHLVVLPGLLRSRPALVSVPVVDGTRANGPAGFLLALPVCPPLLAAGVAVVHGVVQVPGEVAMAVLAGSVVLVALVLGAPKLAASTAIPGLPGRLAGVLSPPGPELGLAAAPPLLLPCLRPSLPQLRLVVQLKLSPAPLSVSRLLRPPLPPPAPTVVLPRSVGSALAERLLRPSLLPCSHCDGWDAFQKPRVNTPHNF